MSEESLKSKEIVEPVILKGFLRRRLNRRGPVTVINASFVHMSRQTGGNLAKIQEELEEVMSHLQRDSTRMTQFRG